MGQGKARWALTLFLIVLVAVAAFGRSADAPATVPGAGAPPGLEAGSPGGSGVDGDGRGEAVAPGREAGNGSQPDAGADSGAASEAGSGVDQPAGQQGGAGSAGSGGASDGWQPARPAAGEPGYVAGLDEGPFADFVAQYRPNELGVVPVLMYHHFGDTEGRWQRRWDNFRRDLQTLYDLGFRAVNLMDYLDGRIDLPAGTSPVIFTFDDSLVSQLRIETAGEQVRAKADSAVGVMLEFAQQYPDFGAAGTFYVNLEPPPFGGQSDWREKLAFLVEQGFEIGNHSLSHDNLGQLDGTGVQRTLARAQQVVEGALPGYRLQSMALPYGALPKDHALAVEGQWDGVAYHHRAVLLVGANPAPSPFDQRLAPAYLPRIQAIDEEFDRWLPFLADARYVSDGDPQVVTVPAHLATWLDQERAGERLVRIYTR